MLYKRFLFAELYLNLLFSCSEYFLINYYDFYHTTQTSVNKVSYLFLIPYSLFNNE